MGTISNIELFFGQSKHFASLIHTRDDLIFANNTLRNARLITYTEQFIFIFKKILQFCSLFF